MDYVFVNLASREDPTSVSTRVSSSENILSEMPVNNVLPKYEETINSLPPTYDEAIALQVYKMPLTVTVTNPDELSVNINVDVASNVEESVRLTNNRNLQTANLCDERDLEDTENIVNERWYRKRIICYSLIAVIIVNLFLFIGVYYK